MSGGRFAGAVMRAPAILDRRNDVEQLETGLGEERRIAQGVDQEGPGLQVAEIAGVSVGSLYQYFSNKDALTVALIEHTHADLDAAPDAPPSDIEDRVVRAALGYLTTPIRTLNASDQAAVGSKATG